MTASCRKNKHNFSARELETVKQGQEKTFDNIDYVWYYKYFLVDLTTFQMQISVVRLRPR